MKFVLFLSILLTSLNVYALAPTLVSQSGNSCIYDDGTVLKSYSCPLRLRTLDENKEWSRPPLDLNSSSSKMLEEIARAGQEQMSRGIRGLAGQDRRTSNEIQAANNAKKRQVFARYLAKKYPNSGLDVLAMEGILTPDNLKYFLTE